MDKKFLKVGTAVKIKKSYIKNHPGQFQEDHIYYVEEVRGSRAALINQSGGTFLGEVTASYLELSSRHGIAVNIENEASLLLEKVKALQIKAERLKRYGSDDEEIGFMIQDCIIEKKLSPTETVQFLRQNGVEIKLKLKF